MPPVSAASSGVSISSGMPRAYGPASAQLNSGIYSSAQVGSGFNAAVQPLDLISDEMDTSSAQLSSGSSGPVGASDAVVQHGSDITSHPFQSSETVSELQSVEPTPAVTVCRVGPPYMFRC